MSDVAELAPSELAPYIQHTLIAVGTTREQTVAHAQECVNLGFDAAMVAGSWVALTAEILAGTGITVASALVLTSVVVITCSV
jgi:deoxyribose-phosphate aldolase